MSRRPTKAAQSSPPAATGAMLHRSTADSFQNFAAKMGVGTGNLSDGSGYGFNFITRNRIGLEAAYRGSWLIGAAIDYPAEDMTSSGIALDTSLKPDQVDELTAAVRDLAIGPALADCLKWGALYGGSLGLMMIDGQDMSTPLNLESIREGQFRGVLPLDRWQVNPALNDLITDLGPDVGMPMFYDLVSQPGGLVGQYQGDLFSKADLVPGARMHHSRLARFEGLRLPYQQRLSENLWGASIIERIFDRVTAFDSASAGAAQLVFRAYIRNLKIKDFRSLVAAGGKAMDGVIAQVNFMAMMQSVEGISIIDGEDEFEALTYTFAGLDDVLLQFAQQFAGAIETPLIRLLGQAPKGLNATGESDMQTYADNIYKKQEARLRRPWTRIMDIASRSVLGQELPKGFTFRFVPIRKPTPEQQATIGNVRTQAVIGAFDSGVVDRPTALRELKQGSDVDGMWSNVTDEAISEAESDPKPGEFDEHELKPPEPKMLPPGGKVVPMKRAADADWSESDHPRDPDGQFTSGGGAAGGVGAGGRPPFSAKETKGLPSHASQPVKSWGELQSKGTEGRAQLASALGDVAKTLGLKTHVALPEHLNAGQAADPHGYLFIAPNKSEARAAAKVNAEYGGDWSKLKDMIRASIAVSSISDVRRAVAAVEASGLQLATAPKDKFTTPTAEGYRDLNTVVRLPNGMLAELQYHVKTMIVAKTEAHEHYVEQQNLQRKNGGDEPTDKWSHADREAHAHLREKQRALYGSAWSSAGGEAAPRAASAR